MTLDFLVDIEVKKMIVTDYNSKYFFSYLMLTSVFPGFIPYSQENVRSFLNLLACWPSLAKPSLVAILHEVYFIGHS